MSRNGASIVNRSIAAKRSGGKSSSGAMCWNPALLTRMSAVTSRPSMVARWVRSACRDRPPIESATDWAASPLMSRTVTAAPASASRRAQASPTPLAAPVTRALRPVKSTPAAAVRALAVLI